MNTLTDRLKNLTAEQKQKLLLKLQERGVKGIDGTPAAAGQTEQKFGEGENFAYAMRGPGNFLKTEFIPKELVSPAPELVQVEVKAASLNFRDLMIAMGIYPATPGVPSVMGSDYAGIVTAVGEGVTEFKVGDKVMLLSAGSLGLDYTIDAQSHFSKYQNANKNQVFLAPPNLSFTELACIPTVFFTSYYALIMLGRLKAGETVLIHTATGGVGMAAVELCKWKNCRIFATAGNESKRALLRELDIPLVMNSRNTDFEKEIKAYAGGYGVDVVLNTLSAEAVTAGLNCLNVFGRFLQIDKKDIAANRALPLGNFNRGLSFSAIDLALLTQDHVLIKQIFTDLYGLFREGYLKPIRHKVFPFQKLGDALNYMSRSEHIGKLVIDYEG